MHDMQQLTYLQLCGLVNERGGQVLSVSLLQQRVHLLSLLLQRLLHLNHRLQNKHTSAAMNGEFMTAG